MPNFNRSRLLLFLGAYALCLFTVLPHLSLWLDEVLNIIGSTEPTLSRLIAFVPTNSGGVPLGYLVQRLSFDIFGVSEFSARLPSALSSLLGAYGMFLLAERLGSRNPILPVVIFCVLPMQWRYAIEGRPYAMALALSIWSTILFLDLLDKPGIRRACVYTLVVTAGLYTNPYSFFIPASQIVWLLLYGERNRQSLWAPIANAAALALFVPWYLYSRQAWIASVLTLGHTSALKAAGLITRELVGAGYVGTALIVLLAITGWKKRFNEHPRTSSLLALLVCLPVPLVLTGDAAFHTFLASRQLIFILPPLCLLAAFGVVRNRSLAAAFFVSVMLLGLYHDIHMLTKPRENWREASQTIKRLATPGTCLLFAPASSMDLYLVFDKTLAGYQCDEKAVQNGSHIVLATSPYATPTVLASVREAIPPSFRDELSFNIKKPTVTLFSRK